MKDKEIGGMKVWHARSRAKKMLMIRGDKFVIARIRLRLAAEMPNLKGMNTVFDLGNVLVVGATAEILKEEKI